MMVVSLVVAPIVVIIAMSVVIIVTVIVVGTMINIMRMMIWDMMADRLIMPITAFVIDRSIHLMVLNSMVSIIIDVMVEMRNHTIRIVKVMIAVTKVFVVGINLMFAIVVQVIV